MKNPRLFESPLLKSKVHSHDECQKALGIIDREMRKRAWGDEKPHAPSYHSEHGWYLTSDA